MNSIIESTKEDENALIFILADKNDVVFNGLSALRNKIARDMNLVDNDTFEFVWIVDFPLFEFDEEENRFVAMHHPFTMPKEEDIQYLLTDKEK